MELVLNRVRWIMKDLSGRDMHDVLLQLSRQIKHAETLVKELGGLLQNHIIRNYSGLDEENSAGIEFSKKAWLKVVNQVHHLQSQIRGCRGDIDSTLGLLCA